MPSRVNQRFNPLGVLSIVSLMKPSTDHITRDCHLPPRFKEQILRFLQRAMVLILSILIENFLQGCLMKSRLNYKASLRLGLLECTVSLPVCYINTMKSFVVLRMYGRKEYQE